MENPPHSLPKKSYRGNGFAGKSVYDDVFGGRPKFGVPTLSPRVEDYSEIFEGFHASRGSSIPVIDLPAVEDEASDLFFDVRSSGFDYSEVFGSFNGSDFAVSYDELFKQSKADDESSDEAWTPAQSESLSDESDPSGCSEKNQSLSSADLHNSCYDGKQFNISYHKANAKGNEDNGVTHVTQLDAIPGYSFTINKTPPSQYVEDESSYLQIERDTNFGVLKEEKQIRKTVSRPPISDLDLQDYETEPNPLAGNEKSSSPGKAFISVSDVSLRTRPSRLPPPSRPPPAFADEIENSCRLNSKLKASKGYVFEKTKADYSPPYFDVEVDASSSAAASAAAMKYAVEKAQAQLSNAKELMERKKEGLQNRTKSHLEKDMGRKDEKIIEFDRFISPVGDKVPHKYEREDSKIKAHTAEERKKVSNTVHAASSARDGKDTMRTEEGKGYTQPQVPQGTVAWTEAAQLHEVVKNKVIKAKSLTHQLKSHKSGANETDIGAGVEQQEYHMWPKASTVDQKCQEIGDKFKVLKGNCEQIERKDIKIVDPGLVCHKEDQEKSKSAQEAGEWQENNKKTRVTPQPEDSDKKLNGVDEFENDYIVIHDQLKQNEVTFRQKLKKVNERAENVIKIKEDPERKVSGMERNASFNSKEYERELKADVKDEEKLTEVLGQYAREKLEEEACERQINDGQHVQSCGMGQNKEKWEEATEHEGKAKNSEDCFEKKESNNRSRLDLKQKESKKDQNCACEAEKFEKGSDLIIEERQNTEKQNMASGEVVTEKTPNDDIEQGENERRLREAWEKKEIWKRSREAQESDDSEKSVELLKQDDIENILSEANVWRNCENNIEDERNDEGYIGQNCVREQLKREVSDKNQENYTAREEQTTYNVVNLSREANTRATAFDVLHKNWETRKLPVSEETESLTMEQKTHKWEAEVKDEPVDRSFNSSDIDQNGLQNGRIIDENKVESLCQNDIVGKADEYDIDNIGMHTKKSKGISEIASGTTNAFLKEVNKDRLTPPQVVPELVKNERKLRNVLPAQKSTSQNPEVHEIISRKKIVLEEREKQQKLQREKDDLLKKIEEEKEREREREKDRMAVDTATREACERAFAETRERAERAAVERATTEVRQRALAEARERLEKASAEARERLSADKASEARLKAERAAVERATAEARERAIEKAKAEKASYESRERVERPVTDKSSAYSRTGGFRQSSSFNDIQNLQHQNVGPSRDLKYSHSSVSDGLEGESAQRCKARLERYQRTAERAAKALAEKNSRDLLAQKEQTERNRLAESLDAEVKRWSSGKKGNLRALLSTLQYILGADSGWQPVPLTDVITAAAVKKAYRKATLCVHPDKLQQRGASIHQKYICEKVFDLLKEAWNKFNSEER